MLWTFVVSLFKEQKNPSWCHHPVTHLRRLPYSSLSDRPLGLNENSSCLTVVVIGQAQWVPYQCHQAGDSVPFLQMRS